MLTSFPSDFTIGIKIIVNYPSKALVESPRLNFSKIFGNRKLQNQPFQPYTGFVKE